MSLILFMIVVLVVLALALYATSLLPLPNVHIVNIIMALEVMAAILVILQRVGVV